MSADWADKKAKELYNEGYWDDIAAALRSAHRAGMVHAMREAAKVAELFQRDASFDDSMVGALEHNSNQANIAIALRTRADELEKQG